MSWAPLGLFMGGFSAGAACVALTWAVFTISDQKAELKDLTAGSKEVVAQAERQFESSRIAEKENEARASIAGKCVISPSDPIYPLLDSQIRDFRQRDFGGDQGGK